MTKLRGNGWCETPRTGRSYLTSPHQPTAANGEQLGAGKPIDEYRIDAPGRRGRVKAAGVVMELANGSPEYADAREVDAVIRGSTAEQAYRGLIAEVPGTRGARLGVLGLPLPARMVMSAQRGFFGCCVRSVGRARPRRAGMPATNLIDRLLDSGA